MKKGISILNVIFFMLFFYSCVLLPKSPKSFKKAETEVLEFGLIKEDKKNIEEDSKKNIKEYNGNICYLDEEPRLNEIKEGEVWELFVGGYVTWAKSVNLIAIKDKKNNLIQNLKGLKYSYIFSPIRFRTWSIFSDYIYYINDNKYKMWGKEVPIAKIIAFESTKEFEEKYEVKSLKLVSEGSNIDFDQYRYGVASIRLKSASKEPGFVNSYNFGVLDDDLTNAFSKLFYKKSKCNYMLAHLTIQDKQTNEDKTYEIALSLKLFHDTIKMIFAKYPDLSNEKLKFFIDE
ncbi:S2/P23 family protein [Borreliella carolinensis]|uniref:S2/P23 family protein n=1 Tax=Borreliella carolinensis TaxID=478174 RepID=UPI0029432A59|nr:S2/P23 family protein [Borreliella carolinensis]WNY65421.1 S2/P23 family protein [Borreliella carolinensis]